MVNKDLKSSRRKSPRRKSKSPRRKSKSPRRK